MPDPPVPTPQELAETLAWIETRLDALEAVVAERETVQSDEVAKLAWAVKHGRQRPW